MAPKYVLSAVVMTHPLREGMARRIVDAAPDIEFRLIVDDCHDISPDGAVRTALRAWQQVEPGATHHLVLQDDVTLRAAFSMALRAAIGTDPDRPFSLFSEWGSKTAQVIRMAAFLGSGFAAVADPWMPAPAVLLPAELARAFAGYLAANIGRGEKRDAFLLYRFLRAEGYPVMVCVPNLVQHDDPLHTSLLPNGKARGPRRTACYIDEPGTAECWSAWAYDRPAILPYHSPHDLVASVCTAPDEDNIWTSEPAFVWLGERGWSLGDLDGGFRAALHRCVLPEDGQPLGHDALKESWIAAFTTGWVLAADCQAHVDPRNLSDIQRAALGTMAAGPYRRVLSDAGLRYVQGVLVGYLADGVAAGLSAARIGRVP
jgi:hypothetical protein